MTFSKLEPELKPESTVLYATQGAVALLTLNRPQALNSFSRQMHTDLWSALDQAEADVSVRALVITGAGRGFCAGADLSEFDFGPDRIGWSGLTRGRLLTRPSTRRHAGCLRCACRQWRPSMGWRRAQAPRWP